MDSLMGEGRREGGRDGAFQGSATLTKPICLGPSATSSAAKIWDSVGAAGCRLGFVL